MPGPFWASLLSVEGQAGFGTSLSSSEAEIEKKKKREREKCFLISQI